MTEETTTVKPKTKKATATKKKEVVVVEETYLDRLLVEKAELDEKLKKLQTFLSTPEVRKLTPKESKLLRLQAKAMRDYSDILHKRSRSM